MLFAKLGIVTARFDWISGHSFVCLYCFVKIVGHLLFVRLIEDEGIQRNESIPEACAAVRKTR